MKLVNVKDGLPDKVGNYWCTIEEESHTGNIRLTFRKVVCWFGADERFLTKYSNQKVISWVDDKEEDQSVLWGNVREIVCEHLSEELPSSVSWEKVKSLYTLIRK